VQSDFDAIPGLGFALSAAPLLVGAKVFLKNGGNLEFTVPIPDIEAALILKALAWRARNSEKDLTDIASLLEIRHLHRSGLTAWGFADERRASRGSRRDARAALHLLKAQLDKGRVPVRAVRTPARLSALIREHVPALN
jgi:hypothetical protein